MISKKRKLFLWTVRGGMYLATALTAGLTLFLMVYVLAKGIPNITWELLSTKPSYLADRIGILPDILNTLYIIIYTLILVLPLGVGAAIYLTEYAHNKKVVAVIEYAAETLSGIPSIIYGLGAGKWRVIRTVVLPNCVDGIVTGCILSIGRILGESAALLFTAGFAHVVGGFWAARNSAGATLTVALYVYAKEQGEFGVAFAIAAILMVLAFLINLSASLVSKYYGRKNRIG